MLGADKLPIEQAQRILSGEALLYDRSRFLLANLGYEIPPGCGVAVHRDEIRSQRVELSVCIRRPAIIGWVEPVRL